jgi:hypothetical protein
VKWVECNVQVGSVIYWLGRLVSRSHVNLFNRSSQGGGSTSLSDSVATTGTTTTSHTQVSGIAEVDLPLACWMACCVVKRATKRAFDIKLRSMRARDVLDHLGPTMEDMIQ